jgi:hypothetical protein
MSDATGSIQSLERLRQHAIAALVPFFLDGPTSDPRVAHLAVESLLDDYHAKTPKELQLSTQIVALNWAALACLRAAVAVRNLSVMDALRLQDSAIALDHASNKATKVLEARRKERAKNPKALKPVNTMWDEGVFQLAINQSLDKLNDANAKLAAYMATLVPPAPAAPAAPAAKLPFLFGEQMTPSVLARRARN